MKNVVLTIARKNVGVIVVMACTVCTTGTQKLDAPSAIGVWRMVMRRIGVLFVMCCAAKNVT